MGDVLFRNKKVALIGPAPHILDRKQNFDDYDLVVRVNNAIDMPPKLVAATGDRMDVYYTTDKRVRLDPEIIDLPDVKIFRGGRSRKSYLSDVGKKKFSEMHGFLSWARKEMGCEPNRGMKAIIDIILDKPAHLYITGFTFYQGEKAYFDGYGTKEGDKRNSVRKGDVGNHKQIPQLRYFSEKVYPLPFVSVDPELDAIVRRFRSCLL